MFLETSALTGENVEEGFLKCARTILNKIDSGTHGFVIRAVFFSHNKGDKETECLHSEVFDVSAVILTNLRKSHFAGFHFEQDGLKIFCVTDTKCQFLLL